MEAFCGSEFWNLNVTWYTESPDFTPCFEKTVLVWIPCGFLWLSAGFEIFRALNHDRRDVPNSFLNMSTRFLAIVLVISSLIRCINSFVYLKNESPPSEIYPVDHVAPAIKAATYVVALVLHSLNKSRGIPTSGVLFMFWFLAAVCGVFEFQSALRSLPLDDSDEHQVLTFVVIMISYPLELILFFLSCFTEAPSPSGVEGSVHKPNPRDTASLPSKIFFSWAWPLVYLGFKKPLEFADMWALPSDDQANSILSQFHHFWKPEFEKCQEENARLRLASRTESISDVNENEEDDQVLIRPEKKTPKKKTASILPALWRVHWMPFLWAMFLLLVANVLMFVSPQLLDLLIAHVDSDEEAWKGYFYAAVMLAASTGHILLSEHYFIIVQMMGWRARSALTSAVYRKSLVISNAARKESTSGEIVNLMSIDAERFNELMMYVNSLWLSPFQIGLALYFLYGLLGPSIFAGLGVLILLVPITSVIAHFREKMQEKQMANKDQRVKVINEVLAGIKVLKFYAWEPSFENEIQKIRGKELAVMKQGVYIDAFAEFVWYTAPFLVTLATFATYVLVDASHILDARKAFVALTLFNIMRMPMSVLPWVVAMIVQTKVSLDRLNKFLNAEEIDQDSVTHVDTIDGNAVRVEDASFCWDDETTTLKNINFMVPKGSLVAVVGVVGSGKSSLLSAILGEMEKKSGSVNTAGSVAYVAQQAWIQNDTLRGNILFGRTFDSVNYGKVIKACALQPDLDILTAGDQTEIGEKGINLSGGQKQRVALARAVYNNADVYLLDDPLSAVDAHVGKQLFEEVVGPKGLLKRKTRVIVTHGLTYLPQVDSIVVMKNGEISEVGTFQELVDKKGAFSEVLSEYLKPEDLEEDSAFASTVESIEGLKDKVARKRLTSQLSETEVKTPNTPTSTKQFNLGDVTNTKHEMDKLIEDEKSEVGEVDKKVYLHYIRSIGLGVAAFTLFFHVVLHGSTLSSTIWLSMWSMEPPNKNGTQDIPARNLYLGVYGAIGFVQAVSVFLATLSMALGSLNAAKQLHNQMLRCILRSPMSFFDTTPLGRILNRFSKDVDVADEEFPWMLRSCMNCLFEVVTTLIAISYCTPWILTVIAPIIIVYYAIQKFYVASSRQLMRLESVSRSPIYSHFSETLSGSPTIRSFSMQNEFIREAERVLDNNQMAKYPSIASNRWLAICLECLGNVLTFFAALFAVITRPSAGLVGLSLTYAFSLVDVFNWLVRQIAAVETSAVAIERIKEYGETPQEAEWYIPSRKPPSNWPHTGRINFRNYQTRYREGLDLVLKDVSCEINAGEKIGIVGRTGAGKSSMTLGLFRIIEAAGGSIQIDDLDIAKLGLHDVRGNLTIIPQDPVLFAGSLRMNLDPFDKYSDSDVWRALEFSHLKEAVTGFTGGLLHTVSEGGENLSVGQRQLVCLARALLRKTKVLILDEATAAVDLETDDLIQETIRREFKECTVLTIAHRLNTIMDYNKVMVLDKGEIREFDSPQALLENPQSIFYGLAKNAGLV